jgi:hypothetical protein
MGGGLARFLAKCTCANRSEAYSDAFSLRDPVLTPDQVRGGLSLKNPCPGCDNARSEAGVIRQQAADERSAVIVPGCNARYVRAIKADIGQFAIAELGQFADIALIVPERLDHADEREQHGSLLVSTIQRLEEASTVEMNIVQGFSFQKVKWCGAAR